MQHIYFPNYFGVRGAKKLFDLKSLADHPNRETIERRLKIISFFEAYGKEATKEAFGFSRSTVYLWKKKLKEGKGRLLPLAPKPKAPKRRRTRETHHLIVSFIKDYRIKHPGVGKEIIHPHLVSFSERVGIPCVSESTVGRVIKDLKEGGEIPVSASKVSFLARSDRFVSKPVPPRRKKLRRGAYRPDLPGDLVQVDSITLFLNGIKRYILTAIDLKSKFAFAYGYKSLSSLNGADFMDKLKEISPFTIERIQTDNGS